VRVALSCSATRGAALRRDHERGRAPRRFTIAALALCLWLGAFCARAEHVALDMSACPDVSEVELRSLLALELPTRLLAPQQLEPADSEHVQIRCSLSEATLTRAELGKSRTLALSSVPLPLRPRVIALAIAELVRPEPAGVSAPAPAAAPVAPVPPAPTASALKSERYHLWAGVQGAALPLFSLGGALALRVSIRPLFAWASALSFGQRRIAIDRGQLRVQDLSLRSGPALSFTRARWTLLLGAAAKLSYVRLTGEAADRSATRARRFDAWLFVPTLFAGAAVALGRGAFAALELEAGHALRRLRADVEGGGARTLSAFRASALLGAGLQW
jgi:hypothetical protein